MKGAEIQRLKASEGGSKRIGYARVSKRSQNEARQLDRLRQNCDEVRVEKASAVKIRPVFEKLLSELNAGDTLVILDLDRAFRSLAQAINTGEDLRKRGIHLVVINQGIDTSNDMGEVVFGLFAVLAEFERKTLVRRTKEGLNAARKRGVKLGRPYALTDAQIRRAHKRITLDDIPAYKMAKRLNVSPATLSSGLERLGLA